MKYTKIRRIIIPTFILVMFLSGFSPMDHVNVVSASENYEQVENDIKGVAIDDQSYIPIKLSGFKENNLAQGETQPIIKQIATGGYQTCALITSGGG